MSDFVNPTLLNAHALPAAISEAHAQAGNHIRVTHHPILGLPVAPFIVQRAIAKSRKDIVYRQTALFYNDDGPMTLPVTVTPERPVTVLMGSGPGRTCIWVSLTTRQSGTDGPRPPTPDRPVPLPPVRPAPLPPILLPPVLLPPVLPPPVPGRPRPPIPPRPGPDRSLGVILRDAAADLRVLGRLGGGLAGAGEAARAAPLQVSAYVASVSQGPAFVGRRSEAPYSLSAPGITELRLTGSGTITAIDWIAGEDEQRLEWQTLSALNLPHPGGRRYMTITDPVGLCQERVDRQAPKRRPLQDTTGAPLPHAAPPFSEAEEQDRVKALIDPVMGDLDRLITDPVPQLEQIVVDTVTDPSGNPLITGADTTSTLEYSRLQRVLQAQGDAGTATFLGYKERDKEFVEVEDRLIFYRVLGYFRDPAQKENPDPAVSLAIGQVPLSARTRTEESVTAEVRERIAGWLRERGRDIDGKELVKGRDYMALSTLAVADRLAPLDPVDPPQPGRTVHVQWLPATTPTREVETPLSGVMVGAILAHGRVQPQPGGSYRPLNPDTGRGWRVPVMLGVQGANGTQAPSDPPGQGFVFDRNCAGEAARYFIAQADRFGRFSPFAPSEAAAGPRPRPPKPVLRATYTQPTIAQAATTGGRIEAMIDVPEAGTLAPGSFALSRVRVLAQHVSDGASPGAPILLAPLEAALSTAISIEPTSPRTDGTPDRRAVPVRFSGPLLHLMEARRMILTAHWIDTAGQLSVVSEPVRLRMVDPRPPALMPIADTLLYASRPDATGLAWVERSWPHPGGSNARYAVYYTDETRLLAHLTETGQSALATTLRANPDRAARAGQYRSRQSSFPDRLFERLEGAVVETAPGQMGFRHAISAASRVLNCYKIVPESAVSGARPDISGADMVLYGVPNSDPPPRPSLAVRQVASDEDEPGLVVEITVTLPKGVTAGQACRLYRTRSGAPDPLRNPVVARGTFGPPDPMTGAQTVVFRDIGSAEIADYARFAPFVRYTWLADAQGAAESGSSVPGRWGQASDPVTLAVVPSSPPLAFATATFGGTSVADGLTDATVTLGHPSALNAPAMGPYRLRLERALPGGPMQVVFDAGIDGAPIVARATNDPPGYVTPIGTRYRATLYDPIGRAGPALTATLT